MNYFFHPDAAKELAEGVEYYENCAPGLGYDFSIEVHSAIKRICSFPKAWPTLVDEVRRCQTNRFPFGVLYIEEKASITILAVMHLHGEPGYWQGRLT